jgi:hypothetical protein
MRVKEKCRKITVGITFKSFDQILLDTMISGEKVISFFTFVTMNGLIRG